MWSRLRRPLIAMSFGVNLAFIILWILHVYPLETATPGEVPRELEYGHSLSSLHGSVNATPEQLKAIEPHIRDFQETARSTRESMQKLRGKMLNLLAAPVVDEEAIQATTHEILAHQERIKNLVIDFLLEEKEILEPDQFRVLLKVIERRCRNCGGGEGQGMMGRALEQGALEVQRDKIPD